MGYSLLFIRYLRYLMESVTRFDVHSPFLYRISEEILNNREVFPEYIMVEDLKRRLLRNKDQVQVLDLGTGSLKPGEKIRTVSQITRTSSKPRKYGRLLYRLVKDYYPSTVIELGTSLGLSTSYMALANPQAKIITVEGCPNIAELAKENFKNLGLSNIDLLVGNFDNKLPEILQIPESVDLIFIDGNHRKEPTINYFEQCLSKINNESVMVMDDIHWSEGMESAWKHVQGHPTVSLTVDLFFMGLVFFRKELTKQHFIIRF